MSEEATSAWTMTAEQATAKLNELTAAYRGPIPDDPHSKLQQRYNTPRSVDRLTSGHPKERGKFDELMQSQREADPVAIGMSGELPHMATSEMHQIATGANWLREAGLPDQAIHDFIAGAPVEQSFRDQVADWKARSMKNADFVKAYLSGDGDAVRRMTVANAVLLSPVKDAA
jgi:hypothetical protein